MIIFFFFYNKKVQFFVLPERLRHTAELWAQLFKANDIVS